MLVRTLTIYVSRLMGLFFVWFCFVFWFAFFLFGFVLFCDFLTWERGGGKLNSKNMLRNICGCGTLMSYL